MCSVRIVGMGVFVAWLAGWLAIGGGHAYAGQVIVAFGDSTTAPRAKIAGVYAKLLQDELPTMLGEAVTVYNRGIGGNRTDQAVARLDADVRKQRPNTVIVQFGINDAWVDRGTTYSRVAINAAAQVRHPFAVRGNYTDNLTGIVKPLKRDGAQVILMTPNQVNPVAYGGKGKQHELLGAYAQVVRDVAAAERVPLVDVWRLYADYADQPGHSVTDLLLDSQHPNQAGHRLVADALHALLVPKRGRLRRQGSRAKQPLKSSLVPMPGASALAAGGLQPPPKMEGLNLLDDRAVAARKAIFIEQFTHNMLDVDAPAATLQSRGVVSGEWKLLMSGKRRRQPKLRPGRVMSEDVMLFDILADPQVARNVAAANQPAVARLSSMIDAWWDLDKP